MKFNLNKLTEGIHSFLTGVAITTIFILRKSRVNDNE